MKVEQRCDVASKRGYRQRARAEASARTRLAVLDATVALAMEKAAADLSLADVAQRAGVSVQTVLRHFGTRAGLLDAALEHGATIIAAERESPDGDVPTAVRILFDHYESRGDAVIRLLAQEGVDARVAHVTESGRRVHREWVRHLPPEGSALRDQPDVIDQLVIVTDVYAWKILRRDRALPRPEAEQRMRAMIEAVLAAATREGASS